MFNVCLVEDEKNLNDLIKTYLEKANYKVIQCYSGKEAMEVDEKIHLWILDIMLGDDISGYDIIKHIRETDEKVPIIFTSARDQDLDKIIGLELGSDDYITKPYSPKELILRVNNIIRRVYTKERQKITYKDYIIDFKKRKTVVKALCLHIAHDCNLACRYCFAGEGEYHGDRALMSLEVAKKSLDFLVANSGFRRNLEVDFFGGEPLMNWDVVKKTVEYGRSLEEKYDKKFRFTLTTNGILLNDEIMEFANKEMANVVLSIDGRKEVHDYMRPTRNGKGSYDILLPKFQEFAKKRGNRSYYVRGTYTHNNLDFAKDVLHMADLGFDQISIEPVVSLMICLQRK